MLSLIKKLFSKRSASNTESDTIYVGNIAYSTNKSQLEAAFENFGTVTSARIIRDRQTGRSKGYGFVSFKKASEAQKALKMDGEDFRGRQLRVSLANEKSSVE